MLQKAQNASEKNTEASALEKIQVEVAGSYGLDGKIDEEQLNNNLKRISGLKYNDASLNNENLIVLPAIVELDNTSYQITNDGTVTIIKPQAIGNITRDNYGDYLDLRQSIVGNPDSTIDDWRILYNDKNGHVYAILADYLPNSTNIAEIFGLNQVEDTLYNVNSLESKSDLVTKINSITSNTGLVHSSLKNVDISVKGSITKELIEKSYKEKYNVSSVNYFYINNLQSEGFDTLYIPHAGKNGYNNSWGFWLGSEVTGNNDFVYFMYSGGNIYRESYSSSGISLRPIVILNSNIKVSPSSSNGKTIWNLVQ